MGFHLPVDMDQLNQVDIGVIHWVGITSLYLVNSNLELLVLSLKLCVRGMPPWLGDFLRLLSAGGASNWFGLVCPAHCTSSLPLVCAIFLAGFSLGSLCTLVAIGFCIWPWICGHTLGSSSSTPLRVSPSTRLAAYLYERPVHSHRLD